MSRPLGALVAGSDAHLLSVFLRRADVEGFIRRVGAANPGAAESVASFRDLVATVHAAADHYAASVASAAEGAAARTVAASGQVATMTTREAAMVLEVTTSRVRQLCRAELLAGELVGRAWVLDAESVHQRREQVA